jgi:AraC family transcriptional regulator
VYLASAFRRCYGHTVAEHVRELRVAYALRRLAESEDPLSDIARAAGFADQSHFSRTFKQLTGTTPGAYRTLSRAR